MAIKRTTNKAELMSINKKIFKNDALSLRARGMLGYLLSLPDDWEINISELRRHFPEGKHVIYEVIQELKQFGYLKHVQSRHKTGAFNHGSYIIYDSPQQEKSSLIPQPNYPQPVLPDPKIRDLENRSLQYKEINNIKNNTAATTDLSECSTPEQKESIMPVAAEDNFVEVLLGTNLTANQKRFVEKGARMLCQQLKITDPNKLIEEIIVSLEDPRSFSQSGNDFQKKFNTIKKCIKEGKWRTPSALLQKQATVTTEAEKILREQIRYNEQERNIQISARDDPIFVNYPEYAKSCQKAVDAMNEKLKSLYAQLRALEKQGLGARAEAISVQTLNNQSREGNRMSHTNSNPRQVQSFIN